MPTSWPKSRIAILAAAVLGVAHFAYGLFLYLRLAIAFRDPIGPTAWFLLPYVVLLLLFAGAGIVTLTRRVRWSGCLLALAIVLSVAMCVYDFKHYRYQITGGGTGATYLLWWWYYEPFWYNYEPGNV